MMIYLDTSVVVSLLVHEAKTADVKTWFAAMNDVAVSSNWLISEFSSAISMKMRAREITGEVGAQRMRDVARTRCAHAGSQSHRLSKGLRADDAA